MEPLPEELRDSFSYYLFKYNGECPKSNEQKEKADLEYGQAIKEKFCQEWAPYHDIRKPVLEVIKSKDHFWVDFAHVVARNWCNHEKMVSFFSKMVKIDWHGRPCDFMTDEARHQQAFESQLDSTSVDYVYDALNNVCRKWGVPGSHWYFPGLNLIQSSGMGKSRAVYELANVHQVYVIYCNFGSALGYPRPSYIASVFADGNEDVYVKYFYCCLKVISEMKKNDYLTPQELVAECRDGEDFWLAVKKLMQSRECDPITKNSEVFSQRLSEITDNIVGHDAAANTVKFLFVFDEARALLRQEGVYSVRPRVDHLKNLRKATTDFPYRKGLAVVFLDTTSQIDIPPPTLTLRTDSEGDKTVKPFPSLCLLPTIDIKAIPLKAEHTLDAVLKPEILYRYGRPLWSDSLDCSGNTVRVLDFAMEKLIGGGSVCTDKLDQHDMLAILRARIPFKVPRTDVATELVASHMSVCTFISEDRHFLQSTVISEPILADAAARWMLQKDYALRILCNYLSLTINGTVDVGRSGEHVAAIIFLLTRDVAQGVAMHHSMLPVPRFLNCFVESSIAKGVVASCRSLEKGVISFNHFSYISYIPRKTELLEFMARGTAVLCKDMERGIDLIIPILMPNNDGQYLLHEDNITYLLVQVKNHKKSVSEMSNLDAFQTMTPEFVGLEESHFDYISILMNAGDSMISCSVIETGINNQISIVLNGIHQNLYPCLLDKEKVPQLEALINKFTYAETEAEDYDHPMDLVAENNDPAITSADPSYLTRILQKLLGRSLHPACFYQKNTTDYRDVVSICKTFYRQR